MPFSRILAGLFVLSWVSITSNASAEGSVLVESEENIGFTLDEEWRRWWRRISDRGGRAEPAGPMQQRFPRRQYPTHQSDMATAEYLLGDEYRWARANDGARFWVHSYNAVELGTNVQMKFGRPVGKQWRFDIRFDRLYTRDTESDLVQADFTWQPKADTSPYVSIGVFPRLEKQDTDMSFTVGYKHKNYGDARLRLWGLDLFASAAYAVAVSRGSPLDYLWKQESVPLGIAVELASIRRGGFRTELYAGGVIPQKRELYTEQLAYVRAYEEWAALFGALVEYKFADFPLWVGLGTTMVRSRFDRNDKNEPELSMTANEGTYQARLYSLFVPRSDMRAEAYLRLTSQPEQITTPQDPLSYREDKGSMLGMRWQWLIGNNLGPEVSYWRYDRKTLGPPNMAVDGTGHRIATRLLWHTKEITATFGVGWDPEKAGFYDGGGGTLTAHFE